LRTKRVTKTFILHNFEGPAGRGTYLLTVACSVSRDHEGTEILYDGEVKVYQKCPWEKKQKNLKVISARPAAKK